MKTLTEVRMALMKELADDILADIHLGEELVVCLRTPSKLTEWYHSKLIEARYTIEQLKEKEKTQ